MLVRYLLAAAVAIVAALATVLSGYLIVELIHWLADSFVDLVWYNFFGPDHLGTIAADTEDGKAVRRLLVAFSVLLTMIFLLEALSARARYAR